MLGLNRSRNLHQRSARSSWRYVGLAFIAACTGTQTTPATDTTVATIEQEVVETEVGGVQVDNESDLVLGLSVQNLERTFFQGLDQGVTRQAEELGVELIVFEAGDDASKQLADVETLLDQQVDGILLSPVDSVQAVDLADKAQQAGVPLLAVANQIGSVEDFGEQHVYEGTVALVTNDDIDMGSKAAELVAAEVGSESVQIAIVEGAAGASNSSLRETGFSRTLDELGVNYEVVASEPGNWNPEDGGQACQRILNASTTIDILFSMSDAMTAGCVDALSPAQLAEIDVVSIGGNQQGIDLVKGGQILGTVCQKPATMGSLALETLVIAIRTGQVDQGLTFYQTPKIAADSTANCEPQW